MVICHQPLQPLDYAAIAALSTHGRQHQLTLIPYTQKYQVALRAYPPPCLSLLHRAWSFGFDNKERQLCGVGLLACDIMLELRHEVECKVHFAYVEK